MNKTFDPTSFASWFELLVKNKMAGPGLCIAGLAVGYLLIQLTRATPEPYAYNVGMVGLTILVISAVIWILLMIGFSFLWLRFVARSQERRASPRRASRSD
jgi:hypothetical protein